MPAIERESCRLKLLPSAVEGLEHLSRQDQVAVIRDLERLARGQRRGEVLGSRAGAHVDAYRKLVTRDRVRVIYEVAANTIIVSVIAPVPSTPGRLYQIAEAPTSRRLRRLG